MTTDILELPYIEFEGIFRRIVAWKRGVEYDAMGQVKTQFLVCKVNPTYRETSLVRVNLSTSEIMESIISRLNHKNE